MPSENKPSIVQIAALAGRRPDAVDAETPRFPLINIDTVRADLRELFSSRNLTDLVCAAACGADLLALEIANELGIRTHIILPFSPAAFRKMSVVDRPGEWGSLYDRVVKETKEQGHLHLLGYQTTDESAFSKTNQAIVNYAGGLAEASTVLAIVVWEGRSRGDDDSTQEFATLAEQAGFFQIEVLTM